LLFSTLIGQAVISKVLSNTHTLSGSFSGLDEGRCSTLMRAQIAAMWAAAVSRVNAKVVVVNMCGAFLRRALLLVTGN
jgi:hypothetical protein